MKNEINRIKEALNVTLRSINADHDLRKKVEDLSTQMLHADPRYTSISDRKARTKQNAAAIEILSQAYKRYMNEEPITYDPLFYKMVDCKLFSLQITKEENLKRFSEALEVAYDVRTGVPERDFEEFIGRFEAFCIERLTLLEEETLVLLETSLMAAKRVSEGL